MFKQTFKEKVNQRFNNNSIIARKNSFLFENSEDNVNVYKTNRNNIKNLKNLLNKNLNEDYVFSRNTEKYIYPLTTLTIANSQKNNCNNFCSNNNYQLNYNNFKLNPKEQIQKELNKLKVSNNLNNSKQLKSNSNNFNNYYYNNYSPKYDLNKIQFDSKLNEFKREIKKDYTLNKECISIRDENIKNQCLCKLSPITYKIDSLLNSPKRSIIKSFSNNNLYNDYNSNKYYNNKYSYRSNFKFINFNQINKSNLNYEYNNLKNLYLKRNKSFHS